jgi:nicotinamide-nucleotide amidase
MDLGAQLHAELVTRGLSVASAESLTGGAVAVALSAAPGASATFVGGVVAYATSVKTAQLGVPASLVNRHGVVSAECAEAMATGVRDLLGSDWAVSTTGVAGPDSQEGKPVGRVYVGLAGPSDVRSLRLDLDGDRAGIRSATVDEAVAALLTAVVESPNPGVARREVFPDR